jgi:hypothetical protein
MVNFSLDELAPSKDKLSEPDTIQIIHYAFFKEGIDLNQFNELPIPYILSIMDTLAYFKKQEEKESKKARR